MYRAIIARRSSNLCARSSARSAGGLRAIAQAGGNREAERMKTGTEEARLGDGGYGDGIFIAQKEGQRPGENRPDPARLQREGDVLERESKGRPELDIGVTNLMADKKEAALLDRNTNVDWRHSSQFSQDE